MAFHALLLGLALAGMASLQGASPPPSQPDEPTVPPPDPGDEEIVADPESTIDEAEPSADSSGPVMPSVGMTGTASEESQPEEPTSSTEASTTVVQPPAVAEPTPVPAPTVKPPEAPPTGPTWSPGAQVFLRGEGRANPDFDSSINTAPDQVAVLERARIQLGATWGPVGILVQAQDARSWGFESGTTSNEANTDLHQGWVELSGARSDSSLGGSIRAGRQEIAWGSQRMIGSLLWAPTARSLDAVRLQGEAGRWSADLFLAILAPPSSFSVPVPGRPDLPPEPAQSRGQQLAAAMIGYAATPALNIEAMAITDFADGSVDTPLRDRRILDFGARAWGTPWGGLGYEVEGHGQAGQDMGSPHRAWAWAASATYVQRGHRVAPGGKVGYAMASGSACVADPTGGDCGAGTSADFFNFYPTNHVHYGLVDLLGWRNMRDLEVTASLEVAWLSAALGYHFFQLQQATGRWRNAGGALVGSGWDPANAEHDLGHEVDFVVSLKPWKPLMVQPGYGVFIPVGIGEALAGAAPQHFAYLWVVAGF